MLQSPFTLTVVLNPRADGGRCASYRVRLESVLAECGGRLRVCDSLPALNELAAQRALGADDVLGIVGGDGTVSEVIGAFARAGRELPRLALLRGGTMNTVARGLGVPALEPPVLLRALADELRTGAAQWLPRSTVQVEGREGFLFGMAVFASFLDAYNALPHRGLLGASGLLVRASLGALAGRERREPIVRPLRAQLTVDTQPLAEATYHVLAAATVPEVGLGFAPFHRAAQCQGRLHALAFSGSVRQLAVRLPALRRGTPLPPALGVDALAERLTIRWGAGAARYSLDGEVHSAEGPLEVRASDPRRIWRPRAQSACR